MRKNLYWTAGIALFLSLIIIPSMMSRESNTLVQAMGNVGIGGMVALMFSFFAAGMSAGEPPSSGVGPIIGATALCISSLAWLVSWLFGIGWIVTQIT